MENGMTPEMALIILDRLNTDERIEVDRGELRAAVKTAKRALRKRIPVHVLEDESKWAICPNPQCVGSVYKENILEHIYDEDITFCEHCGQALDWGE